MIAAAPTNFTLHGAAWLVTAVEALLALSFLPTEDVLAMACALLDCSNSCARQVFASVGTTSGPRESCLVGRAVDSLGPSEPGVSTSLG